MQLLSFPHPSPQPPKPFPPQQRRRMMIRVQLFIPQEPPQESPFLPQPPQPPQAHCVADKSLMVCLHYFVHGITYSLLEKVLQKIKIILDLKDL